MRLRSAYNALEDNINMLKAHLKDIAVIPKYPSNMYINHDQSSVQYIYLSEKIHAIYET